MKILGLDIGTTTISAVVHDDKLGVLTARTVKNDSFLEGESWERIQDPKVIYEKALESVKLLLEEHPDVAAMGLTGQMHGIVYLDAQGEPVSPLYIWQDGRGDLPYDEHSSWASHLAQITGYSVATGYGLVTHYYNLNHGLVPENAASLCTIHDYLAMKFSGRTAPLTEPTDAASFGLYDGPGRCFDAEALAKAGIDASILPEIINDPCLGTGMLGIPVYAGIGDNQASFLGATGGRTDVLLVNMGTGGQISVYSPDYMQTGTLETRPFPDGGWLLVGASLCGGRGYAMLENFFRQTVKMVTGSEVSAYEAMTRALDEGSLIEDYPAAITTFQGTRKDPALRGSFAGIGTENFTPLHFIHSVMHGMADELYGMYKGYLDMNGKAPVAMIGSGNGLRRNKHLCKVFEDTFGCQLILSENNEEAACGAAIYAAKHCK
ncbi:MAG: hypothetical protein J6B95_08760 [Oscillospiraceae bacterium]|nr:hypothetical protein [Oscillospiraceae bacterium]